MTTTHEERMRLYDAVSGALGRLPGESIDEAARRVAAAPHGDPAWRVAHAVLNSRHQSQWSMMARAARAARRMNRGKLTGHRVEPVVRTRDELRAIYLAGRET